MFPTLGDVELGDLSPSLIRRWHSQVSLHSGLAQSSVAKQYRILHAVLAHRFATS